MRIESIRPSTVDGIKQLAKKIKRERNITHTESLDLASRQAGFENFVHAKRQLAGGMTVHGHSAFLTAYWADKGDMGRETLQVMLPKPLPSIGTRRQVTGQRALSWFKVDADDHLEATEIMGRQEDARGKLCQAARELIFMAATGLVPGNSRVRSVRDRIHKMPGRDHETSWIDKNTGVEVECDEPYSHELLAERKVWLAMTGLSIIQPDWPGMYLPNDATLYMVAEDEGYLRELAQRLAKAPPLPRAEAWAGESADFSDTFVSPARAKSGVRKRARPLPVTKQTVRNGARPYAMAPFGRAVDWRPDGRLPIKTHKEISSLIKALDYHHPLAARDMAGLVAARVLLDDWVQLEYGRKELSDDVFRELYYGSVSELPRRMSPVVAVGRIRQLIQKGYPDCPPVRSLLRRLGTVERKYEARSSRA